MQYPKIETLWERDEASHKVRPGEFRLKEFENIKRWLVTEKIDGTNIRVELTYEPDPVPTSGFGTTLVPIVRFKARTDEGQIPTFLFDRLREMIQTATVAAAFDPGTHAILFGEGYGPKIQKGGIYRPKEAGVSFRLFDVVVFGSNDRPWWLNWTDVQDVAKKVGILTVPIYHGAASLDEALTLVGVQSSVAWNECGKRGGDMIENSVPSEGIVARTDPLLFMRGGGRVIWKLKGRDF